MYQVGEAYLDKVHLLCPPDHLSLSDSDFFHRYEMTKMVMLSSCPLFFYVRKTTRNGGIERGMFVDSNSGLAKARSYENLWGPVSWTVTTSPKRWIKTCPHGESTDRPVVFNNQQLLFNDPRGMTHAANIRWGTTGEYIVPKGKFYDHDCEFITTAPAFRNANLKFMGKQKIKTGAGFMVRAAEAYYPEREYDNHRYKNLTTMQGNPQDFYVPIQYTRPQAIPHTGSATGITLNYPIRGFLHTMESIDIIPREYLPPDYPNDYVSSLRNESLSK